MFWPSLHPIGDATVSGDLQTAALLRSFLPCFTLKQPPPDAGDGLSLVRSMTASGKHVLPTSALVSFFIVDNMEVSLRCFGRGGSVSAEELQEELGAVVGKVLFEESRENREELGADPTFVDCNAVLKQFVPPFPLGGFPDVQGNPGELHGSAVLLGGFPDVQGNPGELHGSAVLLGGFPDVQGNPGELHGSAVLMGGFPDVQGNPGELHGSAVLMPPGFSSILESPARQAAELEELLVPALCGPAVK